MGKTLNKLNNLVVRLRRRRYQPGEVLLLFSSCLQRSSCQCNVRTSLDNCKRCGECPVGPLLDIATEFGTQVFMATGGRLAAEKTRHPSVKAVVAVACCKELSEGLRATFPKPTALLELATPNGPCKDTCVDVAEVRKAVQRFLCR